MPGGTVLESIDKRECLELLARKAKVGRVGFARDGRPMVLPVNYISDGRSVWFRTRRGGELSRLVGHRVAFEVDSSDSLRRSGWSVLAHGRAAEVTDREKIVTLERGPLQSWGTEDADLWIRIPLAEVSGRRIAGTVK